MYDCRLRYLGHIVNLVTQAFLFGQDTEDFETVDGEELVNPHRLWQDIGPVGQVYYIFTFIQSSSQRREDFPDLQHHKLALAPLVNNGTG